MAHILCITSGLTGILNASFELSNQLIGLGHRCTNASPANVADKVRAQGFDFLQLDPINFDPAPKVPTRSGILGKIWRLYHKITHARERQRLAIEALGMQYFLPKVEEQKPDLIIVDMELHEHIIALFTSRYNVLLLSQWFSTWNRAGLPPIVLSAVPGNGFAGSSLGMNLSWQRIILNRKWIFLKKKIMSAATDRRSVLRQYARKSGFPMQYIRENYWPGPFSYDRLPVISMVLQELDFPHDIRPNHIYIGPMVSANRNEMLMDTDSDKRLKEVLLRKERDGKQLIYCSVSTFKEGDVHFLQKVVKAFHGQHDWLLIVGLGGLVRHEAFDELPDNVYVFNRVPQLQVLEQADLSINHGGIHTINECIYFQVPMLVYSGKRSDQSGCAARVQFHKVGYMADKDVDTSDIIREKIRMSLNNEEFRVNLSEFNRLARQYQEELRIGKLLEQQFSIGEATHKH